MDNIRFNDEGLLEVNPTASRDEQLAFIDAYRQAQAENTAQIGASAHALGSDLTAPYGGLHGPSEYMKSRYQTPQTESRVASLRTAAQLDALNKVMQNELDKWKNKADQAYRNAVKANQNKGNVNTETIPGYSGTGSTLGVSSADAAEDAPYGITRTYAGGAMGGVPLYYETANAPDGSVTNNVINRDTGSTFHIGTEPSNTQNWSGAALSALGNAAVAPWLSMLGATGLGLKAAGLGLFGR